MSANIFHLTGADAEERTAAVREAAEALRRGGLVVFPTETVYGIGCDALNADAVAGLYRAKLRPPEKPLLLHLYDRKQIGMVSEPDERAEKLLARFTPGPLSLIVRKKALIPGIVTSGGDTVGLRFPSDPVFLAVAEAFGGVIAATSANLSGFSSAKDGASAAELCAFADVILDGGACEYALESTIVSLTGSTPRILRSGALPRSEIEKEIGPCDL